MNKYHFLLLGAALLTPLAPLLATPATAPAKAETPAAARKPNILIIVADDLGYSDIGAFGGEIATPNLDALAARGLKLTGFHAAPTCSPTRSMLLSGTDNHLAGLGNMAELLAPNQRGQRGYEGYLPADIVTLADRLHDLDYATLMAGKWHLGVRAEDSPARHGFDQSFDLAQGGGNHYGVDISKKPGDLGTTYWENGKQLAALPANFYSSDTYASKLIEFLDKADKAKPFFAYLTFTAPHWPLQAPDEDIARYKGKYDAGFEVMRDQRLARQKALGLIPQSVAAHDVVFARGAKRWADLSPEERRAQSRAMEVYAAMVDRMDQNVGRVIAHLKATGQYDNTIILFTADNGAEGLDVARAEIPGLSQRVKAADNRVENYGRPTSYIGYGPGWAQAATAPSWLYKGYTTEGGTRVAAFINWPGGRNGVSGVYGTVMDVVPTLVEAAGGQWRGSSYAGRTVQPVRGLSWKPYLTGATERVHAADEQVGSELFGRRAIRQGDWKAVDLGDGWRLFNLADDPGETRDLAMAEPKRLAALTAAWDGYGKQVGVILPSIPPTYP